nr:DUF1272 domain-containing protein [Henriciella sp.]
MRPNCETCDRDLPADRKGAVICSFECTFCEPCADEVHAGACPNCGGGFMPRPTRAGEALERFPASTKRVLASK